MCPFWIFPKSRSVVQSSPHVGFSRCAIEDKLCRTAATECCANITACRIFPKCLQVCVLAEINSAGTIVIVPPLKLILRSGWEGGWWGEGEGSYEGGVGGGGGGGASVGWSGEGEALLCSANAVHIILKNCMYMNWSIKMRFIIQTQIACYEITTPPPPPPPHRRFPHSFVKLTSKTVVSNYCLTQFLLHVNWGF